MAKSFSQIKSTKLGPKDKLAFGKYKDCRVCDVWDDYEYFSWLDKQNPAMFSKECKDNFASAKRNYDEERYKLEEIDPYINQSFDDVPF